MSKKPVSKGTKSPAPKKKKISKKQKKKKKLDESPIQTSIEINKEAIEIWETITNHSEKNISNKSNYLALKYGNDFNIMVAGEDSGGASECIEDLGAENDGMFILIRGTRVSKKDKIKIVRPITLFILWIPKKFRLRNLSSGLTRAVMSFHLDYIIEKLNLENFIFLETPNLEDLGSQNLVKKVKSLSLSIDPINGGNFEFNFVKTVQQMKKKYKKDDSYKYRDSTLKIPVHHYQRSLCSSFLSKEGGGTMSYSVKRRYHVLTADLRMSYYDKKIGGKKKGDYSIVAARVGKGHPEVWKKKKGIGGIFGKSKKNEKKKKVDSSVNPDFWFFIQTKGRTYCVNAESDRDVNMWIRTLEMVGCIREDHKVGTEFEAEVFGGRRVRSIVDFSGEISETIMKLEKERKDEEEETNQKKLESHIEESGHVISELQNLVQTAEYRIYELEEKIVELARDKKQMLDMNVELKKVCGVPIGEEEITISEQELQFYEAKYALFVQNREKRGTGIIIEAMENEEDEDDETPEDDGSSSSSSEDESGDEKSSEEEESSEGEDDSDDDDDEEEEESSDDEESDSDEESD